MSNQSEPTNAVGPVNAEASVLDHYSKEQLRLVTDLIAPGIGPGELRLFLTTARSLGLDPLRKQIFAVERWDSQLGRKRMTIQCSIDGYRAIAARHPAYAGQTAPQWCGKDGVWRDVWLESEPPAAARVGILRHDFKEPAWGIARWDAYRQTKKDGSLSKFWEQMGDVMLAKCAESLGLRKAFPEDLSGVYTHDEMQQADHEPREAEIVDDGSRGGTAAPALEAAGARAPDQAAAPAPTPAPSAPAPTKGARAQGGKLAAKARAANEAAAAQAPAPAAPSAQQAPAQAPQQAPAPAAAPKPQQAAQAAQAALPLEEPKPEPQEVEAVPDDGTSQVDYSAPLTDEELAAAVHPSNTDQLHYWRVWGQYSPPPWDAWKDTKLSDRGLLATHTPAELVLGEEGGGRHTGLQGIIDATRKKYGDNPQHVPELAFKADYCLAVMKRRYEWTRDTMEKRKAARG